MDWLFNVMTGEALYQWEQFLSDWFFVFALIFLAFELIVYGVKRYLNKALVGDVLTNFVTLGFYLVLGYLVYGAFYVSSFFYFQNFALFDIQVNWLTVVICIVLADFAYYWEHRFVHRVALGWATHTVHHSSPHFNISVAYRFGPMDDFWPLFFHIPLVLIGFDPFVVFFAEMFVQLYQTALHTEVIRKLPRPIEAIMNTPSHHRVHHGSNPRYIDKNYAGIFIIWDRMFGSFAEETEKVVYGITTPLDSINPFKVFFHGFTGLANQLSNTSGVTNKLLLLIKPPGWSPNATKKSEQK